MRGCGALLGLAIGDALGTTNEFEKLAAPPFPELATEHLTEIVGGGPFGLRAGQVTDDTQMACCLYGSLSTLGHFDASDVAARYVRWSEVAFDIGAQTRSSLSVVAKGEAPLEAGRIVWLKSGSQAAGNGSLMRTAPIGAFLAASEHERRIAALDDSAITHFDPRCRLACAAFNAAVAAGVLGAADPTVLWQAAWDELPVAAELLGGQYDDELDLAVAALQADLRAATQNDPELYTSELHLHRHQGFVRVAFRLAFWELLHRLTFRDAVLDATNRGGDADTNAAIVGALIGSRVGTEGIPSAWRKTVLDCKPSGPAVWSTTYHPQIFGC
ncbi:MAG TPA: ADP-ribosylglycohydrolase family protein [Candidatus Limnocylindria bacterium]